MSIIVKVSEYDDLRGHVEYTLEVKDHNGEAWCFKRRYSALRFFHELIKKSERKVPNFPPKKLFGNLNPDFLETRKKQIEQYFMSLTKIPEILHSASFKDFIKPYDKAPIIKNKRVQKKIFTKETSDAICQAAAKIIDEAGSEFISLVPFEGISEEDLKKNSERYSNLLVLLTLTPMSALPKTIPENVKKIKKEVPSSRFIERLLDICQLEIGSDFETTSIFLDFP